VIDLDQLDEQLERALSPELLAHRHRQTAPAPAPAPDRRLDLAGHAERVVELVRLGQLHEADLHIAAHAFLAESGPPADRRDAAGWAAMRALLDGRPAEARAGPERVLALGREAGDPRAWSAYLTVRYRLVLEWGTEDEHDELLDQCREQAYWHDDLSWRGALALLLARLGKADEAARELDVTLGRGRAATPAAAVWLDVTTDLVEAAAVLGDQRRAAAARAAPWPAAGLVVAGRALVCKGSVARYRALAAATAGAGAESDRHFVAATEAHRGLDAPLLLARTLGEWAATLDGRDDGRAATLRQEQAELARGR